MGFLKMRELTFIHLKEQYLAVHEGHVQVSCFCLNECMTGFMNFETSYSNHSTLPCPTEATAIHLPLPWSET